MISIDSLASALPARTRLLSRLIHRASQRRYFNLSPTASDILLAVSEAPRGITELAELGELPQPYVTRIVSGLEERGWVTRLAHPSDRRVSYVTITDDGRLALSDAQDAVRDTLVTALAGFSPADVAALVQASDALQRLIEALSATERRPA